jgi:hypothetical protein
MILQYLKQHKTTLFTLTFIFTFSFSAIQTVSAANITNSMLHVYLDLPEENGVMWGTGGAKIFQITPTGSSIVTIDGKEYRKMEATIWYDFSLEVWTKGAVMDCFSKDEVTKNFVWLTLTTGRDPDLIPAEPFTIDPNNQVDQRDNYSIQYTTFENIVPVVKGVDRRVNIDVSLESYVPDQIDFGSFQLDMKTKEIVAIPQQITVLSSYVEDIGKYNTFTVAQGETKGITSTLCSPPDLFAGSAYLNGVNIATDLQNLQLGAKRLDQNPVTIQQGYSTPYIRGTDDVLERGLYINVVPTITRIDENLLLRSRYLVVDTTTECFLGYCWDNAGIHPNSQQVVETVEKRAIAVTVQHKAVIGNLRVEFKAYAITDYTTIQDPDKPNLVLPETMYDDMYWENYLTGQTGVEISTFVNDPLGQGLTGFLSSNWVSIIIILAIAAVVAFIFLRSKLGGLGGSGGSRTTKFNINIGNRNDKE